MFSIVVSGLARKETTASLIVISGTFFYLQRDVAHGCELDCAENGNDEEG